VPEQDDSAALLQQSKIPRPRDWPTTAAWHGSC